MTNATPLHTFTTQRLVLRSLELADGSEMAAIRSDDSVNEYLDRPPCLSLPEAEAFIRKIQASVANNESYYWAIALKDEHRLIGTVCLWNINRENSTVELGYELFPSRQRQGLMSEAIEKVIAFAFGGLKFKKMVAITQKLNSRSVRLLEKFGFVKDDSLVNEAGESTGEIGFSLANNFQ
jgi:ribosomal-protein-alanine N-acetyltransferase